MPRMLQMNTNARNVNNTHNRGSRRQRLTRTSDAAGPLDTAAVMAALGSITYTTPVPNKQMHTTPNKQMQLMQGLDIEQKPHALTDRRADCPGSVYAVRMVLALHTFAR